VGYTLFSKGANGPQLRLRGDGAIALLKQGVAIIATSNGLANIIDNTGWHHVVATKNGASTVLYHNGVDVTGTVTDQTIASTAHALFAGARNAAGVASQWFAGSLDEAALYSTALSPTTISNHYHAAGY
jgi:hypothetical protein